MKLAKIPSKVLSAAAITASLGLVLPALAAGSPTYSSNPNSMKTSTSMTNGANVTSDSDITKQVKSRLTGMNNLQDANINVSTMAGKVTLTGSVASKDEEKAAKSAAEGIPGVKKVDDDLSVSSKPPKAGHWRTLAANEGGHRPLSTDNRITSRVESELEADRYMRRFDVKVMTVRGVVALSGDLPSEAAVNHAKAVVLQVDGVKSVDTTALNVPPQQSTP